MKNFETLLTDYSNRKCAVEKTLGIKGKFVPKDKAVKLLETVIKSKDLVCLEGNNQKQADFLAKSFCSVNPKKINNIHLVQSSFVLPEHIELFNKGIANKVDFAFSGPQAKQLFEAVNSRKAKVGAIHTYLELYGRYFLDLTPRVCLVVADYCDKQGNLYTGFNTEDTPTIVEAAKFKNGIVIVQVKKVKGKIDRVDIPADWVDYIIETGEDYHNQALFTRDPAFVTDQQILMAMMIVKGIYAEYKLKTLNHGLGYPTAAIELILPTYGKKLGIKGKYCSHWILNPHPTLIPAIEAGIVKNIYTFGGEIGMEKYAKARKDIFPFGSDGNMRSNRCYAHIAGLYAIDAFTGATLQIDRFGNSSTAIKGRIAGFGGAPNLGGTPPGRRHLTEAFMKSGSMMNNYFAGKKLVVQVTPTVSAKKAIPVFVEELDAVSLCKEGFFEKPPVMISYDQVTHIVTEKGIAYLDRCEDLNERMNAIKSVAGDTPVGRKENKRITQSLRRAGKVKYVSDLDINPKEATRKLLAARDLKDLIKISGGLYEPPKYMLEGKSSGE
ncbi:MAG TPA: malonate decarboxylase subunit alpha [bacterium]|nr:malonate decarboxylase subunit alpha [bacterium]HPN29755.1 malonate decarboxylase subunit alpha [bacterium]